jgi:8-oxo-dGTP pyrophosphatase MutT (NUDIX family)
VQYAALPFRIGPRGRPEILLLTSRGTRRWVIPKGWPMRNRKPRDAAAQEAYEEAGLVGRMLGKRAVGTYDYDKMITPTASVPCVVKVFLFEVERQLDDWPEMQERQVRWFDPREASALVAEPGLAKLLRKTEELVRQGKSGGG